MLFIRQLIPFGNLFFFEISHADVEEFQNLGYRPVVVKGESTSFIREKSVSKSEIHSNILVSRYAQKALNGNLLGAFLDAAVTSMLALIDRFHVV